MSHHAYAAVTPSSRHFSRYAFRLYAMPDVSRRFFTMPRPTLLLLMMLAHDAVFFFLRHNETQQQKYSE